MKKLLLFFLIIILEGLFPIHISAKIKATDAEIVNTYINILGRNPLPREMAFYYVTEPPISRISEVLASSKERVLAIKKIYLDILSRNTQQYELNFYQLTKSPLKKIKLVLSYSRERETILTMIYQKFFKRSLKSNELEFYKKTGANVKDIINIVCPISNQWKKFDKNPVLKPEQDVKIYYPPDQETEVEVEYPAVINDNGIYKMWYSSDRVLNWQIGYAESIDGINWKKYGIVLNLGEKDTYDSMGVAFPYVIKDDEASPEEKYKMWYGGRWQDEANPERIRYRIGYATSPDGINWSKKGVVIDFSSNNEDNVDPVIIKEKNDLYKMWFNVLTYDNGWEGVIKYAESNNGINWKINEKPVFIADFNEDSKSDIYTAGVIKDGNYYRMWFTMSNNIYYSQSKDGINWENYKKFAIFSRGNQVGDIDKIIYGPFVLKEGNNYKMWLNLYRETEGWFYGEYTIHGIGQIGYAELNCKL